MVVGGRRVVVGGRWVSERCVEGGRVRVVGVLVRVLDGGGDAETATAVATANRQPTKPIRNIRRKRGRSGSEVMVELCMVLILFAQRLM